MFNKASVKSEFYLRGKIMTLIRHRGVNVDGHS